MNSHSPDAKRIFLETVDTCQPHEWDAFVEQRCAGSSVLLNRVRELLAAHHELLDATVGFDTVDDLLPGARVGDQVGPYKLTREIGAGGFGIVYQAEQLEPFRRAVALKLLKPGVDTRQVIARFKAERQTLALMEHANIARVLDAGTTDSGHPYFVMELVDGISIQEFCKRERSTIVDRLRLFIDVCRAIQYSHLKGIIHRDIKPSNVLVTSESGQPVVKVIDFGVAKALGSTGPDALLLTADFQLIGTPMYMSPEQATLGTIDVDTRSDVYSLGVLLYELLTGVTPFDSKLVKRLGNEELLKLIRNQDPPKPSSRLRKLELARQKEVADERQIKPSDLERQMKPELDWIVMKSLQKQRVDRYQSAGAIAADVERFLNQQPVEACPPSTVYVAKKFLTRHKFVSTVTALVALVLIAATGISLRQASESHAAKLLSDQHLEHALRAKQEVSERDNQLRKLHYALDMKAAWQFWKAGNPRAARQTLQRHLPITGEEDPRDFAWRYLNDRLNYELNSLVGHESPVLEVAVSPDERWIASCDRGGHVLIWDFVTGAKLQDLYYDSREVTTLVFSPDSHWLATAGQDSKIHIWHTADWQESRIVGEHDGTITSIAWSPDGRSIASGGRDQAVRIWDPQSGKCTQEFLNLTDVVRCVTWTADGSHLAAADGPTVRLWETQTWRLEKQWHDQQDALHCLAFSPDGRQLAAAGYGKDIWVYDVQQLVVATTLRTDERYWCVSFSPDNRCLLAGSTLNGPLIWERSGQGFERVFSTNHVEGGLRMLVFADQGRKLVAACESPGQISVLEYELLFADRRQQLDNRLIARNFQQDRLATVAADGAIHFSSFQTGQAYGTLSGLPQSPRVAAFSLKADKLATATEHELCVWDVRQGVLWRQLPDAPWPVHRLLFSPSGRLLACGNDRGDVLLFSVATGRTLGEFPCAGHAGPYFAFSPDESLLATTTDSFKIQLWSTRDAKPQIEFATRSLAGLQFSSDGSMLIVGGERGIEFWDIADNKLVKSLAQPEAVTDIAISPDGRTLASLDIQGSVRLWNLPTDSEMFSIVQHNQSLDWVQFASPTKLVVAARFPDSPNPGFLIFEAQE